MVAYADVDRSAVHDDTFHMRIRKMKINNIFRSMFMIMLCMIMMLGIASAIDVQSSIPDKPVYLGAGYNFTSYLYDDSGVNVNISGYDCYLTINSYSGGFYAVIDAESMSKGTDKYYLFITADNFTSVGNEDINVKTYCHNDTEGDIETYSMTFIKDDNNNIQLWSCPSTGLDMTLMIIIGIILTVLILFSIWSGFHIIGVASSLVLIFFYFFIGACSPILLSPVLIAGITLSLFFAFS